MIYINIHMTNPKCIQLSWFLVGEELAPKGPENQIGQFV